jgi:protein-S-isoprenylcysteine O-methyltransferase Ste14
MLIRAIFAFLMLPVIVTGIIPFILYQYDPYKSDGSLYGLIFLALGLNLLLWCVKDFYIAGKGTLAPWDPPKLIVTSGLYKYVRNPMYISVFFILMGWMILSASIYIGAFTITLMTVFYFRVKLHEEPWMEKNFGTAWLNYKNHTPSWLPNIINYKKK